VELKIVLLKFKIFFLTFYPLLIKRTLHNCEKDDDLPITHLQLFEQLTNPRRYDRMQRPESNLKHPKINFKLTF
jgi:hypothetical protein